MNLYTQQIKDQLLSKSPHGAGWVLEVLYDSYVNTDPEDQARINAAFEPLDACTKQLSFAEQDRICRIVTELCAEHDRIAFLDGIRTGAQLMLELLRP